MATHPISCGTVPMMIAGLRPNLSDAQPAKRPPTSAPRGNKAYSRRSGTQGCIAGIVGEKMAYVKGTRLRCSTLNRCATIRGVEFICGLSSESCAEPHQEGAQAGNEGERGHEDDPRAPSTVIGVDSQRQFHVVDTWGGGFCGRVALARMLTFAFDLTYLNDHTIHIEIKPLKCTNKSNSKCNLAHTTI